MYRDELGQARNRLLDGLKKLNETNNLVASMKADLARLQPELESKAAATADLLVKVRCDLHYSCCCHIIIFVADEESS
jgi:dynein heavy chain